MSMDFFENEDFLAIDKAFDNAKKAEEKKKAQKHSKILVLDDEPGNLEVLVRILDQEGYEVSAYVSANEALASLKTEDFHVILTDQRMPEMLGTKFLVQAKDIRPEAVRIILTGYSDVEDIIESINSGEVFRYILKPWVKEDILQTVKNAVGKSKLERENRKLLVELKKANSVLKEKVEEKTRDLRDLLSQILPEELIDKALYQKYGFKKLNISLMFVDMVGSTEYLEKIKDPEIIGEKFQDFQSMLFQCIQQNHLGQYISETGDGCFAIFGTPYKSKTHQIDAVLAGMQILYRYSWNRLNSNSPFPGTGLRISINAGDVVVGHTGPTQKVGYNALGPPINMASRMEAHAPIDSIIISEEVKESIEQLFSIDELGTFPLKGIKGERPLYTVRDIIGVLENPRRVATNSNIHSYIKDNLGSNLEEKIKHLQIKMFPAIDFLKNESLDGGIFHSRAVCIYTLCISHYLGLSSEPLDFNLVYASLLHDCGKVRVQRNILLKDLDEMTFEEKEQLALLSSHTIDMVKEAGLPKEVQKMIERFYSIKSERSRPDFRFNNVHIPEKDDSKRDDLVECIILADIYDAVTNRKLFCKEKGLAPEDALKYMEEKLDYKFTKDFVKLFS
uniref:CheY-like receiver n=1 Tax=Uncultured bacterium HF130_AEPn_1 TaxID=663362 RepID=D0E8I2_UNCHF|nr:CheY-like receiver [uncultured bacterium HF130_AEPn_1]